MGAHEHQVRTKTDRLIAAVEALTEELRATRERVESGGFPPFIVDGIIRDKLAAGIGDMIRDDAHKHGPISQE